MTLQYISTIILILSNLILAVFAIYQIIESKKPQLQIKYVPYENKDKKQSVLENNPLYLRIKNLSKNTAENIKVYTTLYVKELNKSYKQDFTIPYLNSKEATEVLPLHKPVKDDNEAYSKQLREVKVLL